MSFSRMKKGAIGNLQLTMAWNVRIEWVCDVLVPFYGLSRFHPVTEGTVRYVPYSGDIRLCIYSRLMLVTIMKGCVNGINTSTNGSGMHRT
jgi:hypothetical protein